MIHEGDLRIWDEDDTKKYAGVTEVTGCVTIATDATLDALTNVGRFIYIQMACKFEARKLVEVGGHLYIRGSARLESLTEVGGYLSIYGDAHLESLVKVRGSIYISADVNFHAPKLRHEAKELK